MTVRLRFHTLVSCLWCLAGCASTIGHMPAPEVPRLARDQVAATVRLDVSAPPAVVYDYVVREDTPQRDLRAYGLLPGVRGGVRLTEGGWDHVGARRVVVLEDGSTLREQIEELDRPARFRYRVDDFDFALRLLASKGRGYWDFTQTGAGTRVTWTYVFDAKNCQARPLLRAAIRTQFEPYMRRGLEAIRAQIEGGDS
jgi:hypothetical protein